MSFDFIFDLISEAAPNGSGESRRPGRPKLTFEERQARKAERDRLAEEAANSSDRPADTDLAIVMTGVNVPWLSAAFRMSRHNVTKSLEGCPPLRRQGRNNSLIYDLKTAAAFLVQPAMDISGYLKTLKPEQFPKQFRESYWSAKLKEQRWMQRAGELWPTERVLEAFGETFKTIKETVQLWTDTVEDQEGLTNEQRELLLRLSDQLLEELHHRLKGQALTNSHRSQLANMDDDVSDD